MFTNLLIVEPRLTIWLRILISCFTNITEVSAEDRIMRTDVVYFCFRHLRSTAKYIYLNARRTIIFHVKFLIIMTYHASFTLAKSSMHVVVSFRRILELATTNYCMCCFNGYSCSACCKSTIMKVTTA